MQSWKRKFGKLSKLKILLGILMLGVSFSSCVSKSKPPIVVEGRDFIWVKQGDTLTIPFEKGACMNEANLALCAGVDL